MNSCPKITFLTLYNSPACLWSLTAIFFFVLLFFKKDSILFIWLPQLLVVAELDLSSLTRDQTWAALGGQSLSHWATKDRIA